MLSNFTNSLFTDPLGSMSFAPRQSIKREQQESLICGEQDLANYDKNYRTGFKETRTNREAETQECSSQQTEKMIGKVTFNRETI
jgi:hypothetical protein